MKVWQVFLGVEAVLVAIAAIMPVTPSKTGSGRPRAAEFFFENPGYFHEALVWFVVGNIMVFLIALITIVYVRRSRRKSSVDAE